MFINLNTDEIQNCLGQLDENKQPEWGEMNAKQMVRHLEDTLRISNLKTQFDIVTPKDKLPLFVGFLRSDKEMPKGYKVDYFENPNLSDQKLENLIESHNLELEEFFEHKKNSNYTAVHPIYGELNFDLWMRLHEKHYTHHFKQFGIY